jgi:hypothetical protein
MMLTDEFTHTTPLKETEAMTTSTTMTPQPMTTSDLKAAGLTASQVARLIETRERYSPFREFFTEREFQRLSFLRWQVEHGQLARG